jgi:hypothetical protein
MLSNNEGFPEQSHVLKLPSALMARQEFNQNRRDFDKSDPFCDLRNQSSVPAVQASLNSDITRGT